MNRLFALLLALSFPLLLCADEKAPDKPNTLTPREVKEGWLLLFDGETTFGWKIDGEATVEKGLLVLGGTKETRAEPTTWFAGCHCRFEADWQGTAPPTWAGGLPGKAAWKILSDKGRFAWKEMRPQPRLSAASPALSFRVPAGSRLLLRNVKVQPRARSPLGGGRHDPQGMRPLFNGKDLAGWKVFEGKGRKSKFTVTKEGWLNVKDGPGDLQTTSRFADFVLQLECISNGKRLNSGVFFRCIPGRYQQGYEAQIHNGFTGKPEKTYTIEEYDPQTHKLLGRKKVKFTASDYGTGAIYRRMPARREVARDKEWFTLTVVARGRHIATWVNGVQVVDWTDNRPPDDNARQGYRAAAGAISIQGHDPTTDLSFRNIRIAELPRR
jgi:hypothetical protein